MKVENMTSSRGNVVPNQFIIRDGCGSSYFQSYDTIIAKVNQGKVYLDERAWDYSRTTGKYRNMFLDEDKKTTERKIASGEYELVDLNK